MNKKFNIEDDEDIGGFASENIMDEANLYIYSKEDLVQLIKLHSKKDIEWIIKQLKQ